MLEIIDYLKTLKIMYRCGCSGTKRPTVTVRRPRR